MLDHFPFYLGLIVLIVFLIMLANKLKVAYPILLVIAGVVVSLIPGLPIVKVHPELIFIIFLPPLLYEAAWAISWKELWHWRRIIGSFAFLVVFLTALSVAFIANTFIPGFSLALGFLLGGIVSPPDAVSAGTILRFVKVPKRVSAILEGESLLNDASSLIIFRFALIAIGTGQFVWQQAALTFLWMVLGGIAIGLVVGIIFMKAHKWLPTDANMDIVLTLVTPYAMYIAAEQAHTSGVLAVVAGGLFLSNHRHRFLSSGSLLRGENVWQSLVFIFNGLVFLLIGLQLPEIVAGLEKEGIGFLKALGYGLLITFVLIIGRMLVAYGAVIVTIVASYVITVADKNPGWRGPIILGWTGMRGVVSLAAALSIPVTLDDGTAFPQRNLILFITFVVIFLTLVLQGLTLPMLLRRIKLPEYNDHLPEEEAENYIREDMARNALEHLKTNYQAQLATSPALQQLAERWRVDINKRGESKIPEEVKSIYTEILERQRQLLLQKNKDPRLDEDLIRKYLHYIDVEEEKLRVI